MRKVLVTKEQRLKALQLVNTAIQMKVANSDAVKNGEHISEYELKVCEEIQRGALQTKQGYCPMGHQLMIVFDRDEVPQYDANASCDKCESIINLDDIFVTGFLHCKTCEYNVCNDCRYAKVDEKPEDHIIEVEETVEMSD